MKRTINVNLGGIPFILDEDAYKRLQAYLDTIERHFSRSEGCEDIMSDIEYRICELFQENMGSRKIVSMGDIDTVIKIMGSPEDFGAEPIQEEAPRYNEPLIKTGKKLYRDKEHGMLGGVIAGLSAYSGIHYVTLLRIIWALSIFAGGFGLILYIVMWAVVPEAVSASDRLAMKGEPINIENIAKTIEEEMHDLSKKINDFSNGLSKHNKKRKGNSSEQFDNGFSV